MQEWTSGTLGSQQQGTQSWSLRNCVISILQLRHPHWKLWITNWLSYSTRVTAAAQDNVGRCAQGAQLGPLVTQCMRVCVCPVVPDFANTWTIACQAPVYETLQVRTLEWVAISFSRGSSGPRDGTHVSFLTDGFFTTEPSGKPLGDRVWGHIYLSKTTAPKWLTNWTHQLLNTENWS